MPDIVLGTDKINKKYQKLVASKYLTLQQNILDRIKSMRNTTECDKKHT